MSSKANRPKLPRPSEAMKRTSVLFAEELANWPGVTMRPMFGLRAIYRDGVIFAMLPDKRSFEIPDGIAYKEAGKWKVFAVGDERGIAKALGVLEKAYTRAINQPVAKWLKKGGR
jgi:hypothetical protein